MLKENQWHAIQIKRCPVEQQLYKQIIESGNFITKKYKKGQIIFFQNDQAEQSCIIKNGKVRVYTQNNKNETMTLFQCSTHNQCPISTLSILTGQRLIATAEALEDTEVFVLSKVAIENMLTKSKAYQEYIFKDIFSVVNILRTLLEESSFMSTKERIKCFLSRQGSDVVNITHSTLSGEIGTNRVVVSRVLKELENDGCIRLKRGKIFLQP